MRAALALLALLALPAHAAEVCTYAGATSYKGRVSVQTEVSESAGLTTVRVLARLDASPSWFYDVQFLAEETSAWRSNELQSVAVNGRYSVDGRPRRQQWDVFVRGPAGLVASRVQAKTAADFRRRHGAFAHHWDLSRFGQPWMADYAAAVPERRPDLDLRPDAMPPALRTPFALAFYWSRFLPPGAAVVPVFLPGWKRDARVDAPVSPGGDRRWRMALRHPALGRSAPSWADAIVTGGQLRRILFAVHAPAGDGEGWVDLVGCQGRP